MYTDGQTVVVVGTNRDGFRNEDLVSYGSDISPRPDFIDALEIFEVAPGLTRDLWFDHPSGRYFVCLTDTNTMVVLDDLTIDG